MYTENYLRTPFQFLLQLKYSLLRLEYSLFRLTYSLLRVRYSLERTGEDVFADGEMGAYLFFALSVTRGTSISSSETPPCWNVFL